MADSVRVLLTAANIDEMNSMYAAFLSDKSGRVYVASMAPTADILRANLTTVQAEVAVIDADLVLPQGERAVLDLLNRLPSVAIVLIPASLASIQGQIKEIHSVREVYVKPVNHGQLIGRVYEVGKSERAAQGLVAPASGILGSTSGGLRGAAIGTRVFAFYSSKGGTGKTTTAVNFAYRLMQTGIRTCLMGFDTPDDVGAFLGLAHRPNSLNFFNRPSREGFKASIQSKDGLDVVLSPNDPHEAEAIGNRPFGSEGSISHLIEAARDHHPPYGAIVMDLPPRDGVEYGPAATSQYSAPGLAAIHCRRRQTGVHHQPGQHQVC